MTEYIERDAVHDLVRSLAKYAWASPGNTGHRVTVDADDVNFGVDKIPSADVASVRHGRWLNNKEWHLGRWVAWLECSCCGEHDDNAEMYEMLPFGAGPSNYCPNCGAKMDEEVSE